METFAEDHDGFRDELASVERDGRRRWIYARQPSGRLYRARTVVSCFLLAFLFLAPFIHVGGQPLMRLDVLARHFVLFGVVFRPQDFYLVVLIALTLLVTLVLTTAVFGRLWCGWLCPQTVFMEMLFRRLEYLIEGSAERQLRRDRGPWTVDKAVRKALKHGIVFSISFVIANVFLAWIIGAAELRAIVTDPPGQHLVGLAAILIFTFTFYAVFARFREQACVLACPYGRMLSAFTDSRTITVTYDARRGEPRSRLVAGDRAQGGSAAGACIDCHQCVTVCPTGIDIRNGIQLECVNCTACIDACNMVMRRIGRPGGLIRLTSHDAVSGIADAEGSRGGRWRWGAGVLTARAASYGAVVLVLLSAVVVLVRGRRELDVLILRQPGTLYVKVSDGDLANFYDVQAFNRTGQPARFAIEVVEPGGASVTSLGPLDAVEPYGLREGRLLLRVPRTALRGPSTPVRFAVRTDGGAVQMIDSAFVGPATPAKTPRQD